MSGPNATTQIGIPVAMRPFGMVYNTDMFKAAGITTPPTTWDDLVADAQETDQGRRLRPGDRTTRTASTRGSTSGR